MRERSLKESSIQLSLIGTALLAFTAVIAVLVTSQEETAREGLRSGYEQQLPVLAAPNTQMQISQQLQKYDMAIKRVDEGISHAKLELAAGSRKLGEATQLAVKLHDKLVHDHQSLLAEAARSRAMKQLRSQLAAKQSRVAAERHALQVDALQLAGIEEHARNLLSPSYSPNPKELQAVAQEANMAPAPLSLMQTAADMQ